MKVDPAHLTSLFENATEGIVLTDRIGRIVLVNPAAQKMFGYKEEELIQHPIEVLIPQRYQSHHEGLREDFYQHPENRAMGHGRDLYGKRKDGTDMPVEVSLSHYQREGELFVMAFIIDITERKRIEDNMKMQQKALEQMATDVRKLNTQLEVKVEERTLILKEALKKLEESQEELSEALSKEKELSEIKTRFVSMASHEFRTPLSTILSSATLVSKYTSAEENDKRERHVKKIKDSVSHLNNLLEDFLSLGKLEEGKVTVTISSFGVREFIDDIIEEMKVIQKKGQQIICKYGGEENFTTDKRLLKNILINLFSNAIKFSGENKSIGIDITNNGLLSVVLKDEGVGIPEEDQRHLFTTFFRGKNVTNIEGTGLGLPIVKRYVDLLQGNVSLKSVLGEGTIVYLTLPELPEGER